MSDKDGSRKEAIRSSGLQSESSKPDGLSRPADGSRKEAIAFIYDKVLNKEADPALLGEQDVTVLLKLAGRLRKKGKDQVFQETEDKLRIAVLGSYSIQHFVSVLDLFLTGMGINAEIYEGEYGGINMDVLDKGSAFYAFRPEIALLLMDHRDIHVYPGVLDTDERTDELIKEGADSIDGLWKRIRETLPACQIFQTNIVLPPERALGNMDGCASYGRLSFLSGLNRELSRRAAAGVTIVDMEYLASYIGKKTWFDYSSYFLTKAGFSPDALPGICRIFARLIGDLRGRVYKCVVLDLDNTLWGGVVGDDGWDGIELDPHNAVGEAYRHFQSYLLELKKRGVLLAVCSKNNEDTAKEPFIKNRDMILGLDDISCFVANWEDKAGNIRAIAKSLNIGLDSLVFVDDNPAERQIVRQFLPEVLTVELPEDPAYYARALDETEAFSWPEITAEDVKRAGTYAANAKREELKESFVDYDEYLRALDMSAVTGEPRGAALKRFAQLINKSNQFNLRTRRYSEEEVAAMLDEEDKKLLYVDLKDRFSEYGIISCLILEKRDRECFIDTWLMSCRVLKRGVEYLALDEAVRAAGELGCDVLVGEYLPTKKNAMVKDFYPSLGFETAGEGLYRLRLEDYSEKEIAIRRAGAE